MRLFELIKMRYSQFEQLVTGYVSQQLSNIGTRYGSNTIFGQLINVVVSISQNIFSYIEDSLTEQNKYTATRKRSIYNLAAQTGYMPSLGTTTSAVLRLDYVPNTMGMQNMVLKNHTRLVCSQTGLIFNIILPQPTIILNPARNNAVRYINIVEGVFETQRFVSTGGEFYTINVTFNGDVDLDYMTVRVNGDVWSRAASFYDIRPLAKTFVVTPSLKKGIDIAFGNGEHGLALNEGDTVEVEYLLHNGEYGGIDPNAECVFTWEDTMYDISGDEVYPESVVVLTLQNKELVSSGTNSESIAQVQQMIGFNSRALVLANANNYKEFLSHYSFVGYNRTWTERGSMVVHSLIIKNFKQMMDNGSDYFNLTEPDFYLSDNQKQSLINAIAVSGRSMGGSVFNIVDPILEKYACYIYCKLKGTYYNTTETETKIRTIVGEFFANVNDDRFVPKSDIVHLIKSRLDEIDSVDVYFISQRNEQALIDGYYWDETFVFSPATGTYKVSTEKVYIYGNENPMLGLDEHGNILVENYNRFPVLMGGWQYRSSANGVTSMVTVADPLKVIFSTTM